MKRIVALVIALMFVFSGIAQANDLNNTIASAWKTITVENTSGEYVNYAVPTTTVVPNINMILGLSIIPLGGLNADSSATLNSEAVVALYDTADITNPGSIVSDEVFDEAEAGETSSLPNWYAYPRMILTQLVVRVGPNTGAIIYYE